MCAGCRGLKLADGSPGSNAAVVDGTRDANISARTAVALLAGVAMIVGLSVNFLRADSHVEHGNVAFDISPDGERILFSAADGDLYLLHLKTSHVLRLTKTAATETTPAFSPDGRSLAYAGDIPGSKGRFIFVRSLDGKQVQQLPNDSDVSDSGPSYSPDGSQIVFARADRYRPYSMGGWTWDDWDVCVMRPDGTQVRRITQQKYRDLVAPKFSRDGKAVVYSAAADRRQKDLTATVFRVDASGGQLPKPLTKDRPMVEKRGAWASGPDGSPDGSHIVFISDRVVPYHYDVFIMNWDGTNPWPLGVSNISRYNPSPVFMPDGKGVLSLAGTEWNAGSRALFSLWQVDTEGKKPRRIADSGLFTNPSSWKPKR